MLDDFAPDESPLRLASAALTAARSFLGPYDGMTYLAPAEVAVAPLAAGEAIVTRAAPQAILARAAQEPVPA